MARTKAQNKGDALEKSVQLLESIILGTNPATKDAIVTIEAKKILVVKGVTHEIDIYIIIDYGRGYKACFIFECKNWTKKVDKNEVIVFSRKIADVGAQTGYFIAKSFTRDAKAVAEQDDRISLLIATEELDVSTPLIVDFQIFANVIIDSNATFKLHPNVTYRPGTLTEESLVHYQNEAMLLRTFNDRMRHRLVSEIMSNVPGGVLAEERVFPYTRTQSVLFQRNELTIEYQECTQLDMRVTWATQKIRPPIVSKFDIKTRGRVVTYGSEIPLVGNFQISFVELE